MASFTLDVIALIVDNVDDRGTLFSLLTVSKSVFHHSCRILYRDPMRFFRENSSTIDALENRVSLIRLLVSLSPATDNDTNQLRIALGLPLKDKSEGEDPPAATIDYLSLVHHLSWGSALKNLSPVFENPVYNEWQATSGKVHDRASYIRGTITWSLCGHRLDQVRELEIEPEEIERYIAVAHKLTQLRIIVITAFNCRRSTTPKHTYSSTVRLLKTLQQYHGQEQIHDCCFISTKYGQNIHISRWNFAVHQLLPHSLPHDLPLVQPLRPMDSHLSRLTSLETLNDFKHHWQEICKKYLDISMGKLLQRCRSLNTLKLDPRGGKIDCSDLFSWAADEVQKRSSGKLLAPAVHLRNLEARLEEITQVDALRVLVESFYGFSASLCSLRLVFKPVLETQDEMPTFPFLQDKSLVMKQLSTFSLTSSHPMVFDYRLLRHCPNLTRLYVELSDNQTSHLNPPSWPLLNLPNLTSLTLEGRAVSLFDPVSLHSMSKLQYMTLRICSHCPDLTPPRSELLTRWLWDWDLPELETLSITMNLAYPTFSFRALRSCPKLEMLSLELLGTEDTPPYPLDVASILTNPTQDVFPNLKRLYLQGSYSMQSEDFKMLVGLALPSLGELSLRNAGKSFLRQVLRFTYHHSSLQHLKIDLGRLSWANRKELDLVEDKAGRVETIDIAYPFKTRKMKLERR